MSLAVLVDRLRSLTEPGRPPVRVALDGRSGAGKSTLATAVCESLPSCAVIDGDGFYAGGTAEEWDRRSAAQKVAGGIDWRRQRAVLADLGAGREASWHAYDFEAFDGRLEEQATVCPPAAVVILDGAYSARPELADLLDLRVLLDVPAEVRLERLSGRDGQAYRDDWLARWTEAEDLYFGAIMPPEAFDLVV